jgi:hypothetical protein
MRTKKNLPGPKRRRPSLGLFLSDRDDIGVGGYVARRGDVVLVVLVVTWRRVEWSVLDIHVVYLNVSTVKKNTYQRVSGSFCRRCYVNGDVVTWRPVEMCV